jgi:hypothetical protein
MPGQCGGYLILVKLGQDLIGAPDQIANRAVGPAARQPLRPVQRRAAGHQLGYCAVAGQYVECLEIHPWILTVELFSRRGPGRP